MTKQEKSDILIKDLCARIPYGIKVKCIFNGTALYVSKDGEVNIKFDNGGTYYYHVSTVRPYLRPMQSITDRELKELHKLVCLDNDGTYFDINDFVFKCSGTYGHIIPLNLMQKVIEFLNMHHFDYRRLISLGIALEAPENMYEIENHL